MTHDEMTATLRSLPATVTVAGVTYTNHVGHDDAVQSFLDAGVSWESIYLAVVAARIMGAK